MIHRSDFPVPPELVAAGAPYETCAGRIGGREYELFRNAPATLNRRLAETMAARRATPDAPMTEQDGAVTSFAHFEERIGNFDFETALDDLRAADAARKDTQAR